MPECKKIHKKKRQVCIGDMRDRINIQSRALTAPIGSGVDFTETFSNTNAIWCTINTSSGEVIFDGTGIERDVTHKVYARYISGITGEDWILTENNERFDIIDVENLDNRDEYMLMRCTNRGTSSNAASEA